MSNFCFNSHVRYLKNVMQVRLSIAIFRQMKIIYQSKFGHLHVPCLKIISICFPTTCFHTNVNLRKTMLTLWTKAQYWYWWWFTLGTNNFNLKIFLSKTLNGLVVQWWIYSTYFQWFICKQLKYHKNIQLIQCYMHLSSIIIKFQCFLFSINTDKHVKIIETLY